MENLLTYRASRMERQFVGALLWEHTPDYQIR